MCLALPIVLGTRRGLSLTLALSHCEEMWQGRQTHPSQPQISALQRDEQRAVQVCSQPSLLPA